MLKLLIVADDFTGALDTGVQFSKLGIKTLVTTTIDIHQALLEQDCEVLVIDTESRYLPFASAYEQIKKIILAAEELKIPYIYKKVDSALRGNISAEIKALVDHSQAKAVPFLPAYPEMNRVLIDGNLYIDGTPVAKSIFADDPYEPVTESNVVTRLQQEAQLEAQLIKDSRVPKESHGLLIFDAQTETDLEKQLAALAEADLLHLTIGCAGFAKILSQHLFKERQPSAFHLEKPLVVISGSVNLITRKQIEHAEGKNFPRISLTIDQLLNPRHWQSTAGQKEIERYLQLMKEQSLIVFETLSDATTTELQEFEQSTATDTDFRFKIGESLGRLTEALWQQHSQGTFLFTGGDTLFQAMKVLGVKQILPITEISSGVVLSKIRWQGKEIQVITKSGGFGHQELFEDISQISSLEDVS